MEEEGGIVFEGLYVGLNNYTETNNRDLSPTFKARFEMEAKGAFCSNTDLNLISIH